MALVAVLAVFALTPSVFAAPSGGALDWSIADGDHPSLTWSFAPGICVSAVEIATSPAMGSDGFYTENLVLFEAFSPDRCSPGRWVSSDPLDPGSYYAHAEIVSFDPEIGEGCCDWRWVGLTSFGVPCPEGSFPTSSGCERTEDDNRPPTLEDAEMTPTGRARGGRHLRLWVQVHACDDGSPLRLQVRMKQGRRAEVATRHLGRVDGCGTFTRSLISPIPVRRGSVKVTVWVEDRPSVGEAWRPSRSYSETWQAT